MAGPQAVQRVALIDGLKALASQLIVWHHLAFYGPMSDIAWPLAPDVWRWLADDARIAVQIFLVIAGFLGARSLAPHGRLVGQGVAATLWNRYVRLAVPYLAMLALAVACSAIARHWMVHDSISAPPSLPQLLAHALLLQNVLDVEALSAGVWYVAIDLQLFALFLALLWLARQASSILGQGTMSSLRWSLLLVSIVATASLYHFNLDPSWDNWAVYFFGAYAFGVFAWWGSNRGATRWWGAAMALAGVGALVLMWRERIAVALGVALLLWLARRARQSAGLRPDLSGSAGRWLGHLGQISYSLFLVHFPVCLLVNALFVRFVPARPLFHLAGVLIAWLLSLAAGTLFYQWVEQQSGRLTVRARRNAEALAR